MSRQSPILGVLGTLVILTGLPIIAIWLLSPETGNRQLGAPGKAPGPAVTGRAPVWSPNPVAPVIAPPVPVSPNVRSLLTGSANGMGEERYANPMVDAAERHNVKVMKTYQKRIDRAIRSDLPYAPVFNPNIPQPLMEE